LHRSSRRLFNKKVSEVAFLLFYLYPTLPQTLICSSDFPRKWVECAIPYRQLKKCLKKVTKELQEIGLGKETLARLAVSYHLDSITADSTIFRPRLTIFVRLEDGVAVDAKLTPSTRDFLQKLALNDAAVANSGLSSDSTLPVLSTTPSSSQDAAAHASDLRQVEVPLVFHEEFFAILQTDVSNIGTLQGEEQARLESQVVALGEELGKAVEPSHGRRAKADLEIWRQVFELYLDARIFFSTRETDHGARTSAQAVEQLHWFQGQVVQRKLVQRLKLATSQTAFNNFVSINGTLLSILKFQEINRLAVSKILKSTSESPTLENVY
jgi:hypothetical protein